MMDVAQKLCQTGRDCRLRWKSTRLSGGLKEGGRCRGEAILGHRVEARARFPAKACQFRHPLIFEGFGGKRGRQTSQS